LRTTQVLSIENILSRYTGHRLKSNEVKRLTPEAVEALGFPADVALSMKANVAVMRTLQEQIDTVEQRLLERVKLEPAFMLLKSVPGIGVTLATVIMLEVCDIARFASVGDFSSYCRCVGSVHESNSKKKGAGNTRNGNEYLSWAFVEAAHGALRNCPPAQRFYQRKKCQRNATVATKALAHKLARACFHILRTGKPFEVRRCFA
jgi:transposase